MSKTLLAITLSLLSLTATAQTTFIVRLHDDAPQGLLDALEQGGAAKNDRYGGLFAGVTGVQALARRAAAGKQDTAPFAAYTLRVEDPSALEAMKSAWAVQPGVAYVQDNHRYRLDAADERYDDTFLDSLAHLPLIHAFEAWETTTGSPEVRIGLIDTGLFFAHPDLDGQVWINPGEDLNRNGVADAADFNGLDDDGNGFVDDVRGFDFVDRTANVEQGDYSVRDADPSEDDRAGGGRGHGTLVAGVLAARLDNGEGIAGVAPGCRILPLRAFGADGVGEDDDVVAALLYAARMGVEVINLSFGDVYYSPIMHEAIRFAVAQGAVVVASAGNAGGDAPHYPSDYPEVVSVAWLNEDGTDIAGRGTFGMGIDVGAPGSGIYTTLMPAPGDDGAAGADALYGRRSGSSVAAPMVAGTAALLLSVDPQRTPASVRSTLTATARDLGEPGWDHRTAAGLLDAAAALRRALPARVAIDAPDHDAGWAGDVLAVTGTVADPAFESFSVYFAPGDEDPGAAWERIAGPVDEQRRDDTLAVWQVASLPEGVYTLRLQASLRSGRSIEDRRRLYLDRTAPGIELRLFNTGLVGDAHGVVADLATDDLADVEMRVRLAGRSWTVRSDRRARRHGLAWADETGRGGTADVRITAVNRAGLAATLDASFLLPPQEANTALFRDSVLAVPHGYLLPRVTDFDRDLLPEISLNLYEDGWIGDTLATFEWDGQTFRPALKLAANVIPRDVGDTDGDGLLEMLTQVAGATLLLEQTADTPFPASPSFIDTTGLANPFDPGSAFGARLTDLDGDGRGELLVHNTQQWRILEWDGTAYREVARLDNPTSAARSEVGRNEFQQPLALVDDFDGDGRLDLLVGDGDGDWIVYEVTGDNALEVKWTYETDRYQAGAQFAGGDFDGDGLPEFVTFTQNWTQPTSRGEREPDVALYYLWDGAGDDTYVLVDSLPVAGTLSRHGSMTTADFDGDGKDELVLVHAPDLYLFSFDAGMRRTLRYHHGAGDAGAGGIRSIALVPADLDGDGVLEIIAAGADGLLHRLAYNAPAASAPPPQWEEALAQDEAHAALAWRAAGADSVTVYRGAPGGTLDPIATTTAETLLDETTVPTRYALRAWYRGRVSPLSPPRTVHPRPLAVVSSVAYPDPKSLELVFSEALAPDLTADYFSLDAGGAPSVLLQGRSGASVVLRFDAPHAGADTLRWTGVKDADGRPAGQRSVAVLFPEAPAASLIVARWQILGPSSLRLSFNAALDPAFARDASNYRVEPSGVVASADWAAERPEQVVLEVQGRALGATGLETSLVVTRMRGARGELLADEGNAVSLSQAAENLDRVYVFPNPYRQDRHAGRVMVAGLPSGASVAIFSAQGMPVRRLEEDRGNGGVAWDLTDENGRPVPSGIYLVRVEAEGAGAVLLKAAIIR